jgi:hypothetical protein
MNFQEPFLEILDKPSIDFNKGSSIELIEILDKPSINNNYSLDFIDNLQNLSIEFNNNYSLDFIDNLQNLSIEFNKEPSMDLIEFNKEIYNDTLEMMNVDYIRDDETYNKIIKNTIEKNKEEIYLDINQIRNEINRETEPNIPFLLLLSSLI